MAKKNNSYWNNICEIQKKQTEKGLANYGQTLEDNTSMEVCERITYLQEELVDALMYMEHIKQKLVGDDESKCSMKYEGEESMSFMLRHFPGTSIMEYRCSKCGLLNKVLFGVKKPNYCDNCGREIVWK